MLTPSSNTVLEPVTYAIVRDIPEVSVHFSRFKVTEISLKPKALTQFDSKPMLEAAQLLADADVDVIVWNGTSSGWLGFEADLRLCELIERATGIAATTSVLALNEAFELLGIRRFGLVTPYTPDVNEKIIKNYEEIGLQCVSQQHCGIFVNKEFSLIDSNRIREMVGRAVMPGVEAVTTFCTNLRAAPLVEELEKQYRIPILDTISVVVWKALQMIGISPKRVLGWGRLFQLLDSHGDREGSL